jgi:hypothetical protein
LQPLCLLAGYGCTSGLLQGSGIAGQLPGFLLEGLRRGGPPSTPSMSRS